MPETETPAPSKLTLSAELIFVVLALAAQATMTVELFDPGSVAGKLVSIVGIVLTGLGYTVTRAKVAKSVLPTAMLVALVLGLGAVALPGCAQDTRRDTIHAALVATDSTRAGFVAWDREHQLDLVERATTREEGAAALAEYRGKRDALAEKLVGVYRAIAAASLANDDQSLASLLAAADQLHQALVALTGGKIP